jgi:hypothetical protein
MGAVLFSHGPGSMKSGHGALGTLYATTKQISDVTSLMCGDVWYGSGLSFSLGLLVALAVRPKVRPCGAVLLKHMSRRRRGTTAAVLARMRVATKVSSLRI